MRKCPNFVQGEAVDGYWKQELLIWLGGYFNLKTFVETGTCDGGTLSGVYKYFVACFSIELSEYYYRISQQKFKNIDNVILFQGNSAEVLREKLEDWEPVRTLFWLDAHSSGGLTANEGDPLPEEIRAIIELSPNSLVVIDDHQSGTEVYNKCVEAGIDISDYQFEYRTGIVFMYKTGLYKIPEFE